LVLAASSDDGRKETQMSVHAEKCSSPVNLFIDPADSKAPHLRSVAMQLVTRKGASAIMCNWQSNFAKPQRMTKNVQKHVQAQRTFQSIKMKVINPF